MYAGVAAERRGVTVHRHWWSQPPSQPFRPQIESRVCDQIRPLLDRLGGSALLIGKSLGTFSVAGIVSACPGGHHGPRDAAVRQVRLRRCHALRIAAESELLA